MTKSNVLQLLDFIEASLDDPTAALDHLNAIRNTQIRARAKDLVKHIHAQCINRELVEDNIDSLNKQVLEYAQNNYYCEVPLTERNDNLDSLIMSMNMLGEEINYSTVSRIYFTDIFNTIPDFILVVDDKGIINNVNSTFLETFQVEEKSITNKLSICDIIKDECDYQHLVNAIEDGDNYRSLQVEGNEDLPVTIKMGDFTESANGTSCRVFILRDFTEVLRYQDELSYALKKAQESDRLKSAFLANMSHEIRTPMNGILGFTELLKMNDITEERRQQFLGLIQTSGFRMLNTVNDIIEISKIQSGQMTLVISEFDIKEELDSLFKKYKSLAAEKGLTLEVINTISLDSAQIRTDKTKLISILTNLLNNAIKFTDTGGITIDYKIENKIFTCSISDTGVGIPAERQKAIFDSFVQADIEDVNAYQGSGLGLSISKAHIDLLEGDIKLFSNEGEGTCFTISIPWLAQDTNYVRPKTFEFEDDKSPNWTILIAEDDTINYEYLKSLLEDRCKQIFWARTGVESLNFVKMHHHIDFVLMDIRMPGMDGYEATKRIKKLRPDLPVVAQTAYALPEDKDKAIKVGCDGFLAKPLDINKLKLILRNL